MSAAAASFKSLKKDMKHMTNINCAKPCKFQADGKCCCDSVLFTQNTTVSDDPDCPYLILATDTKKQ